MTSVADHTHSSAPTDTTSSTAEGYYHSHDGSSHNTFRKLEKILASNTPCIFTNIQFFIHCSFLFPTN